MHHVRLNLTHYELTADYGLGRSRQLSLRIPYDIKDMHVAYTTLTGAPFVPPYGDIHHRTETLTGISDPSIDLDWSPRPDWLFGVGTTLPLGHIVPDPIDLGRRGIAHEHIQFGRGTFEPRLSAQWVRRGKVTLLARAEAKLSLYENRYGFRAPSTLVWTAGPSFRASRATIAPGFTGQYQTLGRWSGEVDEGSGFHNGGLRLGASMPVGGITFAPAIYRELWSHGFQEQTFHQGTTWSVSIIYEIPRWRRAD